MLYRVALEGANLRKMALVSATAMLAICLLALVETTNTAEAASPARLTTVTQNGKIAFTSNRSSKIGHMENYDIYTVEPDGSNLRRLTNSPHWEDRPIWSPDGTQITMSDDRGDVGIPVMSADGSNLRYIPTNAKITGSLNFFPTWSADGTKLAFSSRDTPDVPFDILMMDLDGSNQVNLTNTSNYDESYPDFSPDGSRMCFSFTGSLEPSPATGMYLMNADGSDPTLLIEEGGQCDWSPDGTKIAIGYSDFSGDTSDEGYGDGEVVVINADGSGLTNLTSNSVGDFEPRWSPDGTKITFMSDRSGDYDIYTMDANGSNVAPVTTNPRWHDMDPDWQPLPVSRTVATPEKQQEVRQQNQQQVHPPDTGGPSLLLVASALLFSVGVLLHTVVKRRM
jgi:Tol biopolymer transport system component